MTGHLSARVVARALVADDVIELTLQPAQPVYAPPGSHIDVRVPAPIGSTTRSYSVVNLGDDDSALRVAVRLAGEGAGGSAWMHSLQVGDTVEIARPVDGFPPSPGGAAVLLAAGIGVTPMLGLARHLRRRGVDYQVVYLGRNHARMPYVDHLKREHPGRVTVVQTVEHGRLSPAQLLTRVPGSATLYVCGPHGLLSEVRAAWQAEGRPLALLRFETFATSGAAPARKFRVDVPARGVSTYVDAGTTVLDALEDAGIEMMSGCRRGECGLCRARILGADGTVDHRDVFLSDRQRARNDQICTCVSRVDGESITLDC